MRKEGLHLTKRSNSPYWYAWYYGEDGKQKQKRLEYLRAEFSEEEMKDIISFISSILSLISVTIRVVNSI